jgi:hypothetical protein
MLESSRPFSKSLVSHVGTSKLDKVFLILDLDLSAGSIHGSCWFYPIIILDICLVLRQLIHVRIHKQWHGYIISTCRLIAALLVGVRKDGKDNYVNVIAVRMKRRKCLLVGILLLHDIGWILI